MQVISRLMEFEGKSYWEQIDMVCDELKKAGFIKESVKYTRGNHMDYYMKDGYPEKLPCTDAKIMCYVVYRNIIRELSPIHCQLMQYKAGFIKESVKYTRGNHMDYYMKDGCEFVFIDLYNATINARQGIVMDKLVFESEGFAEKRATLSFKSRHATKANDDRTLVPLAFSEGSIVLHQLAQSSNSFSF